MNLKKLYIILFKVLIVLYSITGVCQAQDNIYYDIKYNDSLQQEGNAGILLNNVKITSRFIRPVTLLISFSTPKGWRSLSSDIITMPLAPGESQIIPVNLVKQPNATAEWKPVKINIQVQNTYYDWSYNFFVRGQVVNSFRVSTIEDKMLLSSYQDSVNLHVKIRNRGTTEGHYTLKWESDYFNLNDASHIIVAPHGDTEYTYAVRMSKAMWSGLQDEDIALRVTDDERGINTTTFKISRIGVSRKEHISPYNTMPAVIEGGIMAYGRQTGFYGAVNGAMQIDSNSKLNYFYRSRQIGYGNGYQYSIWGVEYLTGKWDFFAGRITDCKQFINTGQGIRVGYKLDDKTSIIVAGSLHDESSSLRNDVFSATLNSQYHNILFSNTAASNFDQAYHVKSYLDAVTAEIVKTKTMGLTVNAGMGKDDSLVRTPGASTTKLGTSIGYSYRLGMKKWTFASLMQRNGDNYPGIYKGFRSQHHEIGYMFSKTYLDLFYESNRMSANYLKDTVYNSDVLMYNMHRYGIRASWNFKTSMVSVGTGVYQQAGQYISTLPDYQFVDLSFSQKLGKYFDLRFMSMSGFSGKYKLDGRDLWLTNLNGSISSKYAGIEALYVQMPTYNDGGQVASGYTKTMNIGPYLSYYFFNKLSVRLQYFLSKSLTDNAPESLAGFNLVYTEAKKGLVFSMNGMVPLSNDGNNPEAIQKYGSITVRKDLAIPIVTKRKYYNMKLMLFNDVNNNGIQDDSEQGLQNVRVNINDIPFVTDTNGVIQYKNVEPGNYQLDFYSVTGLKGIIPGGGFLQSVIIRNTNAMVPVPFKKGKIISGRIYVKLDSNMRLNFTPDGIKIIITDTAGHIFSALTNESGEFSVNVPAGVYTVSLNPAAFNDEIRPVRMSYAADVSEMETASVRFEITERKRKINMINAIIK